MFSIYKLPILLVPIVTILAYVIYNYLKNYKFDTSILDFNVNKKLVLTLLFIISIFAAISVVYYNRIVKPTIDNKYIANKEFLPENDGISLPSEATLYYFYTSWCPHCKLANSEWKDLISQTGGTINNKQIIFKDIDCDNDSDIADKFNVTGYPTIKLVYNNTIYNYDAKPDTNTLLQFLNSVIT
jgi:thiol-disulfide isomerase/thioredoxin